MHELDASRPQIVSLLASGTARDGVRSEVRIRDFAPLVIDEPPSLGGADAGPNPMEYVLAAYIGCASVMTRIIAQEIGLSISDVHFDIQGDLDARGFMGVADVKPHFSRVSGRVRLNTTEDPERIRELVGLVENRCPVFRLLQDAGVCLEISWEAA